MSTKQATKGMVYSNRFFSVFESSVSVRGSRHKYFSIKKANAIAVLPVTADGSFILERQFRPAIDEKIYEIPAGHIEKGETPRHAALRELEEETGYRAGKIIEILQMYTSPGVLDEKIHIFVATMLRSGSKNLDPMEEIELKVVSEASALAMIQKNEILDAKTITAILSYWADHNR